VYGANPWTLFKHSGHGSATYTAGTGTIVSAANTIANTSASADKLNTDAGDYQTPVYFSNGVPVAVNTAASGANFGIVPQVRNGDGVMEIGKYIDFHATNASTNDYDVRILADDENMVTLTSKGGTTTFRIAGTMPRLRFRQTTSGKEYNEGACGIWCQPASTYGVNMFMQSGGNLMIGAGEFCTDAYARKDSAGETQVGYDNIVTSTAEKLYLGADNEVQIISNGNNIATYSSNAHKVWKFQTDGTLLTPGAITDTLSAQHVMIQQNVRSDSNCVTLAQWIVNGAASTTYRPGISFHNTGGDSTDKGAIILSPYHHNTDPWGKNVGLYIGKGILKLDGTNVSLEGHTHDYAGHVTQSNSTTTNYRALMLGYNNSTTPSALTSSITQQVYACANLYAQPSTGLIGCTGRKLITPFAIQTGSSKRQKITLQNLMNWLITTKKYIHSGIYEHVVLQTTWKYADNDILRLAINGVNYEMDLAGVRIEYIGSSTSYNTGEFTLKIISNPVASFTSTSGYTKFPPATIAVYTCNGSSYAPVWRMIMNGACGQPKIFESTDNLSVLPMPIEVTGLFTNWKVLLAQCTRLIYGGGDECSSFQVIIPLEYLKSLGTSGEMHIPLPFTVENNPIGRNYMILKYVNDNKFTIGYHNDGIDTIGGRGLWTMYGMY
jgi:hypothetical protein